MLSCGTGRATGSSRPSTSRSGLARPPALRVPRRPPRSSVDPVCPPQVEMGQRASSPPLERPSVLLDVTTFPIEVHRVSGMQGPTAAQGHGAILEPPKLPRRTRNLTPAMVPDLVDPGLLRGGPGPSPRSRAVPSLRSSGPNLKGAKKIPRPPRTSSTARNLRSPRQRRPTTSTRAF